jgi:hypothetical protein
MGRGLGGLGGLAGEDQLLVTPMDVLAVMVLIIGMVLIPVALGVNAVYWLMVRFGPTDPSVFSKEVSDEFRPTSVAPTCQLRDIIDLASRRADRFLARANDQCRTFGLPYLCANYHRQDHGRGTCGLRS